MAKRYGPPSHPPTHSSTIHPPNPPTHPPTQRYYDKLHKEYVLADLSRYKEGKVGLRWRVEREVVEGTGQYSCGSLGVSCTARQGLASYELNFKYREGEEVRNELVKVRLTRRRGLPVVRRRGVYRGD